MGNHQDRQDHQNHQDEDRRSALLVRDVMDHAVAQLPPPHDLLPGAVAQGRRRRARTRLAVAAAVACVAGAALFGSSMLPRGAGGATTVRPAATTTPSPVPEPYRTPVRVEPTGDDEPSRAPLAPAEQQRREQYQQRAAVLLDALLPDSVGLVRPVEHTVLRFQGETRDGKVFPVALSVRPPDADTALTCAGMPAFANCQQAALPDGTPAIVLNSGSPQLPSPLVRFSYRGGTVTLTVFSDEAAGTAAPVGGAELLRAVGDPRFLDLVRDVQEHPIREMQERRTSVAGG
ncbi:hypothetical protein OOK31_04105 [Streptomyces sp. NBC_00249]|uniref:hypothetical protein n=1 Tax=Streptomyces sp. NBC_00249 TaxID=2975690 RepID=UPI00225BDAE7|nr:hypothetical protein [Streptomyces sp. NBC_00249]MCX5193082.1 hypothetical protein [Streptomyces sp. NBC_00249]